MANKRPRIHFGFFIFLTLIGLALLGYASYEFLQVHGPLQSLEEIKPTDFGDAHELAQVSLQQSAEMLEFYADAPSSAGLPLAMQRNLHESAATLSALQGRLLADLESLVSSENPQSRRTAIQMLRDGQAMRFAWLDIRAKLLDMQEMARRPESEAEWPVLARQLERRGEELEKRLHSLGQSYDKLIVRERDALAERRDRALRWMLAGGALAALALLWLFFRMGFVLASRRRGKMVPREELDKRSGK